MALSNMQVFEQYAYGSATETIAQQVDLFNEATRGAITLVAAQNEGDYSTETFWKEIAGLTRRRDAYGSGAVAAVALAQEAHTGVKIAGGTSKRRSGAIDGGDADDLMDASLDQRDLVFERIKGADLTTPMDAADVLDVTLHEGRHWIDDEYRELIGRVSKSLRALV